MESFQQLETGLFVFPRSPLRRAFFRAPRLLWRMGLEPAMRKYMLVLTQRGRRSGQPRHTMVEYCSVDGRVYITSGWGERAQWYRNVQADPHVTVQAEGRVYGAKAIAVSEDAELTRVFHVVREHSPMWKPYLQSLEIEDTLDDVLAKKDRMTILRLEPTEDVPLPPLKSDLLWVWPAAAAVAGVAVWLCKRRH